MNWVESNKVKLKAKRTFLKQGTCSRTLFHILNREFNNPKPMEENASDPLAGGINQCGYQCGMLWGAAMGVGAESYRKFNNRNQAVGVAISTTTRMLESFKNNAKSDNCSDITDTDWSKKNSILKYFIRGKMVTCFRLAGKWAPFALNTAIEGLSENTDSLYNDAKSCASEVIKKMGGTEEEMVMVAGFAGGYGLSGNACGALSAAIWMNTLRRVKANTYKYTIADPEFENIMKRFFDVTHYEIECSKICGKKFNSVAEHTEYIQNGGCEKLINILSLS